MLYNNPIIFNTLMDELSESVQICNEQGDFKYVNKRTCELLGYSSEELASKKVYEIESSFQNEEQWKQHYHALKPQEKLINKGIHIHKKGYPIPVEASVSLIQIGDEIFAVAIVRDLSHELHLHSEQNGLLNVLKTSVRITEYILNFDDNHSSINAALEMLGRSVEVDRVYIFENVNTHGIILTSMTQEWVNSGITKQINNPDLHNFNFPEGMPRLYNILNSGKIINTNINDLPEDEQAGFEAQDIISLLLIPIIIKEKFWGFIGFDSCTVSRTWKNNEISLLVITANTLGLFIERKESFQSLKNLLKEKETLLAELHHRTKNNLAIISGIIDLQELANKNMNIKEYSENIRQRVQNIALIHEILSSGGNFSQMSCKQYIEMLLRKLQSTFDPSHKVENITNIDDFNFTDLSQMVSIGILLNEIILNAYKHAFLNHKNPQLRITLTRNNELIEVRIHDNGKGIAENDIKKAGMHSVGFKIIQGLVAQLKAQLVINNENGMQYYIKFQDLKTS